MLMLSSGFVFWGFFFVFLCVFLFVLFGVFFQTKRFQNALTVFHQSV